MSRIHLLVCVLALLSCKALADSALQPKPQVTVVGDGISALSNVPKVVVQQKPGQANTTIVVHVVNDTPNPPPTPPVRGAAQSNAVPAQTLQTAGNAQPAAPQGGLNLGLLQQLQQQISQLQQVAQTQFGNTNGLTITPAANLMSAPQASPFDTTNANLKPVPLSVTTPAADLSPQATEQASTAAWDKQEQIGTFSMQSIPGVRIVSEEGEDTNCGCDRPGEPCDKPCKGSAVDQLEAAVDSTKTKIVQVAQKIQQENRWVKAVKEIIKHYHQKIKRVDTHLSNLKGEVKQLFSKKKHYEDLLLQQQLDEEKFKNMAQKQQWAQVTDPQNPEPESDCQEDCCQKQRENCNCKCSEDADEDLPANSQSSQSS